MPDYPFTTATGVATLLCIPIAYFTFKSASHPLATSLLIGWIFIENLLFFVDSIIWSGGNPDEWWDGKIYCDINSRVKSVWMIGVPGAAIGMCRFLADATKSQAGDDQCYLKKRRRNLIDFTLGILLPLLNAGLKFIVNPQRYSIIGVQGCIGLTEPVWLAFPLYYLWTPILSFVAAVYAGLFLRRWWNLGMQSHIGTLGSTAEISQTDFRRLFLAAIYVVFLYFPLSIIVFIQQLRLPRERYSWERIHGPQWAIIGREESPIAIWNVWIAPVSAVTLFSVLGTTRSAIESYKACFSWISDIGHKVLRLFTTLWKCQVPTAGSESETNEHNWSDEWDEAIHLDGHV